MQYKLPSGRLLLSIQGVTLLVPYSDMNTKGGRLSVTIAQNQRCSPSKSGTAKAPTLLAAPLVAGHARASYHHAVQAST